MLYCCFKAQLLSRYDLSYPSKRFTKSRDRTIAGTNIDDCVRACNNEMGFDCKAFDFCYTNGDCRLSQTEVSDGNNELTNSFECDVYQSDLILRKRSFLKTLFYC